MNTLEVNAAAGVLEVELNRPQRRNAMSRELLEELTQVIAGCRQHAILISGRGAGFCAGADLRELSFDDRAVRSLQRTVKALGETIESSPAAIIAHVHGAAIGGGFALAALCDLVFAASDAVFSANQLSRGLVPDLGLLWVLPRALGELPARRLLLLADRLDAGQALAAGLVARISSREEALVVARTLAAVHEAVTLTKKGLRAAREGTLAQTLEFEVEAESVAFRTPTVQRSIAEFVGG